MLSHDLLEVFAEDFVVFNLSLLPLHNHGRVRVKSEFVAQSRVVGGVDVQLRVEGNLVVAHVDFSHVWHALMPLSLTVVGRLDAFHHLPCPISSVCDRRVVI